MSHSQDQYRVDRMVRLLVTQAHDHAVILLDTRGHVLAWLAGSEKIFGYAAAEMDGQHYSKLFTPEDIEKNMPAYELEAASQNGIGEDDRWMMRKDGLRFWATGATIPLEESPKSLVGFAKILRNRTDLKGQLESLLSEVTALRQAEEKKDAFIATLAHELRNPLSAILGTLYLVRTGPAQAEEDAAGLLMVEQQARQMSRLVDDLLEATRLSRGKVQVGKERVNLEDVVKTAADSCRLLMKGRSHEFRLVVPGVEIPVLADAMRLHQVFVNLIQNAAKYTQPGGKVWVKLAVEGQEAVVKVEDTGAGISPELLPRIFDLFVQSDFAAEQPNDGLGIGLSLVKNIVSLHGGSVQVRSDGLGKGSEFIIRLPLAIDDAHRPDHPTQKVPE